MSLFTVALKILMPCSNAWNKVSLESVPQVEVPCVNYCQSSTRNEVNNASGATDKFGRTEHGKSVTFQTAQKKKDGNNLP